MAEFTLNRFADVHSAFCHPALRQSLYDAGELIMKDVLLTLHGAAHKTRRHLELRLFRRDYARYYESEVFPATVTPVLEPRVAAGEMDLVDFGYRVTMNLTADFAGIDRQENSDEETDRLLRIVKTFSEGATIVHTDRDPNDVINEVMAARSDFKHFLRPSWQRRERLIEQFNQGQLAEDALPRDVLTVLLRNQDKISLPIDTIEREIAFYLQAGSHSTANSMVHAIHEIFTWSDEFAELPYDPLLLQKCVHESMRLHPASPVAWRTPTEDLTLANNLSVTPEDLLILDLQAANRDTDVFGDDAHLFNPNRSVSHPRTELYGLTFGTGVHMCTGRDLDGGVASNADTKPDSHQYGIVCQLISTLLRHGMTPHPEKTPVKDMNTTRDNWGFYPISFRQPS